MKTLQINNLTFKYTHKDIFTNLNLSFEPLWTCIIGNNGCGKTTLLKLISKQILPQSGSIVGNDLVYHCVQELENKPLGFDEFSYTFDSHSYMLRDMLEIQDEWFYMWKELSFGQKKRIQIAIALYADVDILLLDEPTNHLDEKSKKIVLEALKTFKGCGILVSHDREILNSLCEHTIIIQNENIYKYNTNYTNAMKELKSHINFLKKENENINTQLKKLQNNIKTKKEKVSLSKSRLSKKNIDKKDKSTKEKINLAKLTGKDKNDAKQVSIFSKKYETLEQKLNKFDKDYKKGININSDIAKKRKTFSIKEGSLKLSDDKTLYFPNLNINHDDKIAIIGNNGVGKSSFLKFFISQIEFKNSYFYLPQELSKKDEEKLYKEVNSLTSKKKGLLFTLVKRLSSNPKNILDNVNLSQGELRKLFIAKALLDEKELIILDEPTNHMDIDSLEAMERALGEYQKALIVVSHDKVFLQNLNLDIYEIKQKSENIFYLDITHI
ncbi:MAG: ABC-F family ATP-binding cassette domain-containing protein [Arcobacter sp.]|nr:ABC-F family ATP-binding cassette domain-containing protein [Arcobacter sp.]